MIRHIANAAFRLDNWLQARLGRPYNLLLSVGLVVEISRQGAHIAEKVRTLGEVWGSGLSILVAAALLVHQIGALSHRFSARDAHGATAGRSQD